MPRQMDWIDTRVGLNIVDGAQGVTAIDGGSTQVVQRGTTIIRTIITLHVMSSTVAGAWGAHVVDLAIGITDREAFTAGVVPDPDSAVDKPARGWMWRTQMLVSQNGVSTPIVTTMHADVRGARKIDLGRAYLVVNSNLSAGTAFAVDIRGLIRTLVKLA